MNCALAAGYQPEFHFWQLGYLWLLCVGAGLMAAPYVFLWGRREVDAMPVGLRVILWSFALFGSMPLAGMLFPWFGALQVVALMAFVFSAASISAKVISLLWLVSCVWATLHQTGRRSTIRGSVIVD